MRPHRVALLQIAVVFAALVLACDVAQAASGKIIGRVVDAGSGLALSGVRISIAGAVNRKTQSASDGNFTFPNLLPGSYILITDLEGYETVQSDPIAVVDGMEQQLTLRIERTGAATTILGPNLTIPPPLFTYAGDLRAFYFARTNGNTCLTCKAKGSPNATAFNFGGQVHGQLNIPHSPWVLGATYFGANPFGANAPGLLSNIGYNPLVDNTLPGYSISLLGEAYVQYKTAGTFGQIGKEVLSPQQSPWAPNSDSRIEPTAFQGALLNGSLTPDLSIGAMYMARFRSRVTSAFDANTLLTSCNTAFSTGKGPVMGAPGVFTVPGDPCNKPQKNKGFLQFSAVDKLGAGSVVASVYDYEVYDITRISWVTTQWNFNKASTSNPYVAAQFLAENDIGAALIGTVHNHTYGGLFGATLSRNLNLTIGYNYSPFTTDVVPAARCKGTMTSPQPATPGVIFGGVANTAATGLPPGTVQCYGGGVASPYTDNYATDPLFTTQISQGLADTHKAGSGVKAALTWLSNDKRIRLIVSDARYDYGLPGMSGSTGNADSRDEFNADITYFFNRVRNGPYKGLSIRQRYADRTQSFSPFNFKYSRTQFDYTF